MRICGLLIMAVSVLCAAVYALLWIIGVASSARIVVGMTSMVLMVSSIACLIVGYGRSDRRQYPFDADS